MSFLAEEIPTDNDDEDDDDDGFRQYLVHVITGDVMGAGTDADVFIIFIGSQNKSGKLPWKSWFLTFLILLLQC